MVISTDNVVLEYFEAYNAKDFGRLRGLLSDDMVFVHHNRGAECTGGDAFVQFLEQMAAVIPERSYGDIGRRWSVDNLVFARSRWAGTPTVDLGPGMEAGQLVEIDILSLATVSGGRIARLEDFG